MTVVEAIVGRYSCRAYEDKPIEPEKLDVIFEAARLAPSAKNFQDWRFVVVTDSDMRRRLAEAASNQRFLQDAGAVIVACSTSDYVMRCGQPVAPIDVAIALEHIALQATELGLATCWIGSFDPQRVRALLNIPEDVAVIELMPLGYPADKAKGPNRLPMDKICCFEKWQF
jgi:nitroreductase